MRSEKTEEEDLSETASHPLRAKTPSEPAPVIPLYPDSANAPGEPPYRSPPVISRWRNRHDPVAEAMERQAAKRAAHQAALAEQEIS